LTYVNLNKMKYSLSLPSWSDLFDVAPSVRFGYVPSVRFYSVPSSDKLVPMCCNNILIEDNFVKDLGLLSKLYIAKNGSPTQSVHIIANKLTDFSFLGSFFATYERDEKPRLTLKIIDYADVPDEQLRKIARCTAKVNCTLLVAMEDNVWSKLLKLCEEEGCNMKCIHSISTGKA